MACSSGSICFRFVGLTVRLLLLLFLALDQVFIQALGGPATELGAPGGSHTIAHGDDDLQVVILVAVILAVSGSCQVFLDNSIFLQLPFIKDIFEVQSEYWSLLMSLSSGSCYKKYNRC